MSDFPYSDFEYINAKPGNLTRKPEIKLISEFVKQIPDEYYDWHRSCNRFSADYLLYCQNNQSVSGFQGRYIFDYLLVDIDSESVALSVDKLKFLFDNLKYDIQESLFVFFSGSKGFHVYIPAGLFKPKPLFYATESKLHFISHLFKRITMTNNKPVIDKGVFHINSLHRVSFCKRENGLYNSFIHSSQYDEIMNNPKLIHEIAKTHNRQKLNINLDDWFTGKCHWDLSCVPDLEQLWGDCSEYVFKKKEGTKLVPTHVADGVIPDHPNVPQCIKNRLNACHDGTLDNRNDAFCGLAAWYNKSGTIPKAQIYDVVWSLNETLTEKASALSPQYKPLSWTNELQSSIHSILTRDYPHKCASTSSKLSGLFWCNDSHDQKLCPENTKIEDDYVRRVMSPSEAIRADAEFARSMQGRELFTGIPEFDSISNGIFPEDGDILFYQGASQAGKSVVLFRQLLHMLPRIKQRNQLMVVVSPDDDPRGLSRSLTQGSKKLTLNELWQKVRNGGVEAIATEWEEYDDTLVLVDGSGLKLQDCKKIVETQEKKFQKKTCIFVLDGLTYSIPSTRDAVHDLAQEIKAWFLQKKMAGISVLHLSKDDIKNKRAFEIEAGYGSMLWGAAAKFVLGFVHFEQYGVTVAKMAKAKRRMDDSKLVPIPFIIAPYYYAYRLDEALTSPNATVRQNAIFFKESCKIDDELKKLLPEDLKQ